MSKKISELLQEKGRNLNEDLYVITKRILDYELKDFVYKINNMVDTEKEKEEFLNKEKEKISNDIADYIEGYIIEKIEKIEDEEYKINDIWKYNKIHRVKY